MAIPKDIQRHLDTQAFDAVEDAWLTHLEENPEDIAYFAAIGRALERAGEGERSRFLLEMVDEQLRDGGRWPARLELLRACGGLVCDAGALHPEILSTLAELYGEYPSYEQLVDKVGLHRAIDDMPKIWKKADRLAGLLDFDIGSIVHLEGKGAGRVTEVNMALESFKVEFEGQPELRVGFGGAAKLLQPLSPGHFLRRKLEDRPAVEKLRDSSPAELLKAVLESYDGPRTGAEIRRDVSGLVVEKKWNSWWTSARKHPQVLAAPSRRGAYTWAASTGHAQDAVWQAFEDAEPRPKLELLRKNAARDRGLKVRMSRVLASLATKAVDDDPGLACEIWFNLKKYGVLDGEVAWAPAALVVRLTDEELVALGASVRDRAVRERTYTLARGRRTDWPPLAVRLLWQETEPRVLDNLFDGLVETSPETSSSFFDQLISRPRKNPAAFTWLAERAKDEPPWLGRNPLRFLKQILWSLTSDDFSPFKGRLTPLFESGSTVPRLLGHLSEEQAAPAAEALNKSVSLLDYQRKPLLNALYLRFPSLREDEEVPLYATLESIAAKREELRQMVEEEMPANRRAIETAREHGDLRENFEYKSARDRHEYLSARATVLDRDLRRVRPIDPEAVDGSEVVIGSRVSFEGDGGASRALTILGPWNSLPEEGILSNESEIAQALLGCKVGEQADLDDGTYRITAIEPWE